MKKVTKTANPQSVTNRPILHEGVVNTNYGVYLRPQAVMDLLRLKKSTWFAMQDPSSSQYDPSFPSCYQLTTRTKVWKTVDVLSWIESRKVTRTPRSTATSMGG